MKEEKRNPPINKGLCTRHCSACFIKIPTFHTDSFLMHASDENENEEKVNAMQCMQGKARQGKAMQGRAWVGQSKSNANANAGYKIESGSKPIPT